MRVFRSLQEVTSEITRDLKELAVVYPSHSVQNQNVTDDPRFMTHELINYSYSLHPVSLEGVEKWDEWPYIQAEFGDRMSGVPYNPGTSWLQDADYWQTFLNEKGEFDYTYPERLSLQNRHAIQVLAADENTRRGWFSIWTPDDIRYSTVGADQDYRRVPCSLGYSLMRRRGEWHMHYVMRSCDFIKHFRKDVALAIMWGAAIAQASDVAAGREIGYLTYFTHTIFSLHGFAKDLEGVF